MNVRSISVTALFALLVAACAASEGGDEQDSDGASSAASQATVVKLSAGTSFHLETKDGKPVANAEIAMDATYHKRMLSALGDWRTSRLEGAHIGLTDENGNFVLDKEFQFVVPPVTFAEKVDVYLSIGLRALLKCPEGEWGESFSGLPKTDPYYVKFRDRQQVNINSSKDLRPFHLPIKANPTYEDWCFHAFRKPEGTLAGKFECYINSDAATIESSEEDALRFCSVYRRQINEGK